MLKRVQQDSVYNINNNSSTGSEGQKRCIIYNRQKKLENGFRAWVFIYQFVLIE